MVPTPKKNSKFCFITINNNDIHSLFDEKMLIFNGFSAYIVTQMCHHSKTSQVVLFSSLFMYIDRTILSVEFDGGTCQN